MLFLRGFFIRLVVVVLLVALMWVVFTLSRVAAQDYLPVDAAVVFVIDRSTSMYRGDEKGLVNLGHISALQSKEVLTAIREGRHGRIAAALVEFGNDAVVKVPWHIVDGLQSAKIFAGDMMRLEPRPERNTGTSITAGLLKANDLLRDLPYDAVKSVVDVTGDGGHNVGATLPPNHVRDAILSRGATINGLPILVQPDTIDPVEYYERNVVGGPASFNLPVYSFEEYPMKIRQKLLLELF